MTDSSIPVRSQIPTHNQSNDFSWGRMRLDALLATVISIILGLMTINKLQLANLNADTVMLSVMSIQKPTLFYWGQDRFFNLVPILLSPIKHAGTNLFLQVAIFSSAFYGLLTAIAFWAVSYLSDKAPRIDRYLLAALMVAMALVLLSPYALYMMSSEAQPYALSFLFVFGSARLLLGSNQAMGRSVAGVACMIVAMALNPSVLIIAATIGCGALAFVRRMRAGIFVASAVAGFLLWMLAARFAQNHPVGYFGLDFQHLQTNLLRALDALAAQISLPAMIALVGAILIARMVAPSARSRRANFLFLLGIGFCLGWWAIFGNHQWIIMNAFSIRYFSPIYVATCAGIAIALYLPLSQCSVRLKLVIITLCAATSLALLADRPSRPEDIKIIPRVAPVAEYARLNGIRFVAGDYWLVWPTVFMLLDHPDSAFGLAFRGDANRAQVRKALAQEMDRGSTPRLLCLNDSANACETAAHNIAGAAWRPTEESCPGNCRVLEMVGGLKASDRR